MRRCSRLSCQSYQSFNCDSFTIAKPSHRAVRIKKPFPDIEFDYMRRSDLQIVAEIERQSFSDPWSLPTLREAIDGKNPHSHFHVARLSQVPLAYVNYWLILDEAHIVNFAVSPAHRRTGLGKYILAKSLDCIRDQGGSQVHLEVRRSNIPAQTFTVSWDFGVYIFGDGITKIMAKMRVSSTYGIC